ncbi:hypothetical protein PMI42_04833 [Bradyrhizobium sp. YR681]|uniref:hypothetical protein n=1 Tax=Bradyrhizobium sp. YR681 TaxID=1144344 RepID=UPI0002710D27|nr:hypothetical protein [Bradyrhizobium sp. YR681]EJN11819.1 hypothetical protein PMI42_04833 [Bradyrhizobium sp. YR681]
MTRRLPFFNAHSISIGTCSDPLCRAVHVHLLDEDERPHAQLTLNCDKLEDVIADLRSVRDRIVMGGAKKGLDN